MSGRFWATLVVIGCFGSVLNPAKACTMPVSSSPEIEIEINFEDYDFSRDRVLYKIQIEVEIFPPSQTAQCQCGLGLGSTNFMAPASFSVIAAAVGVKNDEGKDDDLEFFDGFAADGAVATTLEELPGFSPGATGFGLSTQVDPFTLPPILPGDRLVLGFLIEFAPGDFDAVNGNTIQFAAGSNEPGHPLALFANVQPRLSLPPTS